MKYGLYVSFLALSFYSLCYQEDSLLYYGTYSDTYVNRWGIQKIAQHVFDPRVEAFPTDATREVTFDPKVVKKGDIVFVRHIRRFMREVHPFITQPYVMVTAGDYKDKMNNNYLKYLNDDNIIAWFCVHPCQKTHPKYYQLPLGIFQKKLYYDRREELTRQFALWRTMPKEKLLCSNFGLRTRTKPKRDDLYELFKDAEFCYKAPKRSFLEYMAEMAQFKFVLSPSGVAPDTYRTWEALLVGCIPILESCYLDELYADLPVLIIDNWNDITPEFLEMKYQEITSKKYNIDKLFMEYWWEKIEHVRNQYLSEIS